MGPPCVLCSEQGQRWACLEKSQHSIRQKCGALLFFLHDEPSPKILPPQPAAVHGTLDQRRVCSASGLSTPNPVLVLGGCVVPLSSSQVRPGPLLEDLVCCLKWPRTWRWAKSFLWVTVGERRWLQLARQRYRGGHHEVLLVL